MQLSHLQKFCQKTLEIISIPLSYRDYIKLIDLLQENRISCFGKWNHLRIDSD